MDNIKNEVWKDVVGYEGLYQVSSIGRVKSLDRTSRNSYHKNEVHNKGRILKQYTPKGRSCYPVSALCVKSITKNFLTHRLVAMAFIPNPLNKPQVNHINGIKGDNRVENLEWCTASENNLHAFKTGLSKRQYGVIRHVKIHPLDYSELKSMIEDGTSYDDIMDRFGIFSKRYISTLKKNNGWARPKGIEKNARLNELQVKEIRDLHSLGLSTKIICEKCRLSYSIVNNVIKGSTYSNI